MLWAQVTGHAGWDVWHLQQEDAFVHPDGSQREEEGCASRVPPFLSAQRKPKNVCWLQYGDHSETSSEMEELTRYLWRGIL